MLLLYGMSLSSVYQARFTSSFNKARTMTSAAFSPRSNSALEVTTVHWGRQYGHGNATVEVLMNGSPLPNAGGAVSFEWRELWVYADIEFGPASGGTDVTVHGHGFDIEHDRSLGYFCRFTNVDDSSMDFVTASQAIALDVQTLLCITPPWYES